MTPNEPASRRVRLLLAYDGSHFHGFATNEGVRTVAGSLNEALSTIARCPIEVQGAGRTDAGVHAWGQVVSVDLPHDLDLESLPRRLTKMCAPGIVVREAAPADADFSARFSATFRRYRYLVLNDETPDPFLAATTWHVTHPLQLSLMQMACDPLVGEHDFSSFCRRPKEGEHSLVRRVMAAEWTEQRTEHGARLLRFEITASAFCHQMVRSIVGTLVDVGAGKITPGQITGILAARSRSAAGQVAPPEGLCLWEVGY
ncbi:MAG: tRNA pseudouridine(38-40) synthase TruA [Acidimicrobiales bacterium mtb01]|nr:tRNA pseudouridine(38-40) synthase TruA [Actinomycetota bacterium]TEX47223.1 MAG: tRNA pseudouridine(38-40) synthase TruA [Acidimicrobiales bacterium mtb01]